jgi:hypothetical protein
MKQSKFSEEQIIPILREAEKGEQSKHHGYLPRAFNLREHLL